MPLARAVAAVHPNGVVELLATTSSYALAHYENNHPYAVLSQCGVCARIWDNNVVSGSTPTPSARCPFEYDHDNERP